MCVLGVILSVMRKVFKFSFFRLNNFMCVLFESVNPFMESCGFQRLINRLIVKN